ncbi:NUDIX hydrolase [Actinophytocola sp.]|uniref:NUDIX hydrolase n=1 Tax=Actinophytocola sp. TaxID=1872138 RepID=UPI003D6ACEB4
MPPTSPADTRVETPRIGARVLLLDSRDRVLLIHARDPDQPDHHWWELPGGGVDPDETLEDAAIREVAEETGIQLDTLGPRLWIRESRFRYRNHHHHRIDHVFLARPPHTDPTVTTRPSDNEKLGLIERRWLTPDDLDASSDKLLPPSLPAFLRDIVNGHLPAEPISMPD